jgi:2Fe-2S ferredoxin
MARVIYIDHDGTRREVEADEGASVMATAVQNNVPGIEGECGGCLSCATCHVYVAPAWTGRLPAMEADEDALLEGVTAERRPESRLSCQIVLEPELDGLEVLIPESQV